MTRTSRRTAALAVLWIGALGAGSAAALEFGDPNMSRDAAYCRQLAGEFHQAVGRRTGGAGLDEIKRTGERGAFLCRMDRYREGITRLERALAALREHGAE